MSQSGFFPIRRWTAHFSGRVQGVGFRMTAARLAVGLPITGYVMNLPDGRVKLVAECDKKTLNSLFESIKAELADNISSIDVVESEPTGDGRTPQPGGIDIRYY